MSYRAACPANGGRVEGYTVKIDASSPLSMNAWAYGTIIVTNADTH